MMAKRKPAAKPKAATEDKREVVMGALFMSECGAEIKAQDCAAYSVLVFNRGDSPEGWQQMGVEAFSKFAQFGWATFHALGGLDVDWDKSAENIIAKLKQLPRKEPKKKSPTAQST